MPKIVERLLRAGEGRILKKLEGIAAQVNALEEDFEQLTDAELRDETDGFRERLADGETLDDLLPEAFAAVREAAKRTLGQRHFDVQIMGGAALHLGNIAEMKTGEGKTLVATLPAYLNALDRQGRARRHGQRLPRRVPVRADGPRPPLPRPDDRLHPGADDARPSAASSTPATSPTARTTSSASTTCATTWRGRTDELVQRGHNFAIVDEVDSILIDEARTPLIISGPADQPTKWYVEFARMVERLSAASRAARATTRSTRRSAPSASSSPASSKVEDYLGIDNLYESRNTPLIGFLNNAIKAKELFKRDKDYVVMNGEVLIVDEHTGRILAGRRYNEGMHQAIEAKEGVRDQEREPDARHDHAAELLPPVRQALGHDRHGPDRGRRASTRSTSSASSRIPTNRPMVRTDQADLVYRPRRPSSTPSSRTSSSGTPPGQPVLVGTASVEKSEYLSEQLRRRGIPHEVLNAKQHAREAAIVAQAGRKGAVTVATNMAGRGTDIMLGGNAEFMAVAALQAAAGSTRSRPRRSTRPRGPSALEARREGRRQPSTTRSPSSAVCTCSAPSGTSRAASTTSCAAAPAVRATPARAASTSRCRTT